MIVFEAAKHVRLVKEKAEFVKLSERNDRWIMMILWADVTARDLRAHGTYSGQDGSIGTFGVKKNGLSLVESARMRLSHLMICSYLVYGVLHVTRSSCSCGMIDAILPNMRQYVVLVGTASGRGCISSSWQLSGADD